MVTPLLWEAVWQLKTKLGSRAKIPNHSLEETKARRKISKGPSEPSTSVVQLEVYSSLLWWCEALQSHQAASSCCPPSSPASLHGAGRGEHTMKKGRSRCHCKLELLCSVCPHPHSSPTATSCPERRRCDLGALHGSMQKDGNTRENIKA